MDDFAGVTQFCFSAVRIQARGSCIIAWLATLARSCDYRATGTARCAASKSRPEARSAINIVAARLHNGDPPASVARRTRAVARDRDRNGQDEAPIPEAQLQQVSSVNYWKRWLRSALFRRKSSSSKELALLPGRCWNGCLPSSSISTLASHPNIAARNAV
jgi:hypothetical protein